MPTRAELLSQKFDRMVEDGVVLEQDFLSMLKEIEFIVFNKDESQGDFGLSSLSFQAKNDVIEMYSKEIKVLKELTKKINSRLTSPNHNCTTILLRKLSTFERTMKALKFAKNTNKSKIRSFLKDLDELNEKKWNSSQKGTFSASLFVPKIVKKIVSDDTIKVSEPDDMIAKYDRANSIASEIRAGLENTFTHMPTPIVWMILGGIIAQSELHDLKNNELLAITKLVKTRLRSKRQQTALEINYKSNSDDENLGEEINQVLSDDNGDDEYALDTYNNIEEVDLEAALPGDQELNAGNFSQAHELEETSQNDTSMLDNQQLIADNSSDSHEQEETGQHDTLMLDVNDDGSYKKPVGKNKNNRKSAQKKKKKRLSYKSSGANSSLMGKGKRKKKPNQKYFRPSNTNTFTITKDPSFKDFGLNNIE